MAKVTDDQGLEFKCSVEGQTSKGMAQASDELFLQQGQKSLYSKEQACSLQESPPPWWGIFYNQT